MKARAWPIILLISVLAAGCGDEAYLEIKNSTREPVMVKKKRVAMRDTVLSKS